MVDNHVQLTNGFSIYTMVLNLECHDIRFQSAVFVLVLNFFLLFLNLHAEHRLQQNH